MIFITVGTTNFSFLRMADLVGQLALSEKKQSIVFQHGATPVNNIKGPNITFYQTLSYHQQMYYLKKAEVVICHGGPATIFQVLALGKNPWVLPREKQYGEHVDDHQVHFGSFLAKKHLINLIWFSSDKRFIYPNIQKNHYPVFPKNCTNLTKYLDWFMTQKGRYA